VEWDDTKENWMSHTKMTSSAMGDGFCSKLAFSFLCVFFCAFYTLMNNDVTPTNAQYLLKMMY
jgi:hypothetical protein